MTTPRVISEDTTEPISVTDAGWNAKAEDDGSGSVPPVYVEADILARLITTARKRIETETELSLVTKVLEISEWSLGPPQAPQAWVPPQKRSVYQPYIELPWGPVHSIVSVTYVDATTGLDTVLPADQYRITRSKTRGLLGSALLIPAYNTFWPASVRYDIDSVRVRYTAGFPITEDSPPQHVPEPLIQAMHLLIGHMYENRESIVVGVGAITTALELPQGVEWMLQPYRQNLGV